MIKDAIISSCGVYRYMLSRNWAPAGRTPTVLCFIMLNPSTADGTVDDPTVRKCIGFADRAACDAIAVLNLFALRSVRPLPASRWSRTDVGDQDLKAWTDALGSGTRVVCAWGAGAPEWRVKEAVADMRSHPHYPQQPLWCLGVTATGAPRHPLYVPYSQEIVPWIYP